MENTQNQAQAINQELTGKTSTVSELTAEEILSYLPIIASLVD